MVYQQCLSISWKVGTAWNIQLKTCLFISELPVFKKFLTALCALNRANMVYIVKPMTLEFYTKDCSHCRYMCTCISPVISAPLYVMNLYVCTSLEYIFTKHPKCLFT